MEVNGTFGDNPSRQIDNSHKLSSSIISCSNLAKASPVDPIEIDDSNT